MKAFLVWNIESDEGLVFTDKHDARYAATGKLSSNMMGVSTIASEWRDCYAFDDPERIFPIIKIDVEISA